MSVPRFLDRLRERTLPHYGVLVLGTLLVSAVPLAGYFLLAWPGARPHGDRTGPATVLSFLPDAVLLDRRTQIVCGVLFAAGAVLWVTHRLLPWSAWLTALAFTGVVALYAENATQLTHVAHLTNALLILYALWYHTCRDDTAAALRHRRFWRTPIYPRWVYSCSVFAVGSFYGVSGLMKWLTSGPGWANGVSMQLWARLWGDPDSVWTRLILADRRFAAALQWGALVGETAGFVAIVSRRLRPWIGLLLIGFHVGQIAVFGWGFHANMMILALVFLPFYEWLPRWVARRVPAPAVGADERLPKGPGGETPPLRPEAAIGAQEGGETPPLRPEPAINAQEGGETPPKPSGAVTHER